MQENYRTYKSKTCSQLKLFVLTLVTQDQLLLEISNNSFFSKVDSLFSSENYFNIFYFIKNHLNINSSTDLGKQYLRNIFTNLAVRVRVQIKNSKTQDKQEKVLEFFDKVALLEDYNTVDITDFQQLSKTFRSQKVLKKRDFAATQQFYRQTGPVPKKQQLVVLESNYRTSDEQYIDNNKDIEDSFVDDKGNLIDRKSSFVIDPTTGYLIDEDSVLVDRETGDPIDKDPEHANNRYISGFDSTNNNNLSGFDSTNDSNISGFDSANNMYYSAGASRRFLDYARTTPTPTILAFRVRNITALRNAKVNTSLHNLDLRNFTNNVLVDETIIQGGNKEEYKEES